MKMKKSKIFDRSKSLKNDSSDTENLEEFDSGDFDLSEDVE
ncbi:MAG: hypothetical protein WC548_00040 [Candidatus Pacearchaeota archaeon]